MEPLAIRNDLPTDNPAGGVLLGLLRAEPVAPQAYPPGFDRVLDARLALEVRAGADATLEARRLAARDMLRNGRYKPTGRGKPASEYLVRAAHEGFPRINAVVDIANLMSLQERLPISLWDLDRIGAWPMRFRLGAPGEHYVFNVGGQTLEVADLVVGCRLTPETGPEGEPVVSPIKDSQLAKTADGTYRVAACVYAPLTTVSRTDMDEICARFAHWLMACGSGVTVRHAIAAPGEAVSL